MVLAYVFAHVLLWGMIMFMAFCRVHLSSSQDDGFIYRMAVSFMFAVSAAKLIAPVVWHHPITLSDLWFALALAFYLYSTSKLKNNPGTICKEVSGILPPIRF